MKSAPIEPLADPQLQLLMTPSAAGHSPFINAIHDAHHSVHMVMFHLTDKDVVAELEAATKRNLDVKVIVDGASVAAGGYKTMFDEMQSEGVDISPARPRSASRTKRRWSSTARLPSSPR